MVSKIPKSAVKTAKNSRGEGTPRREFSAGFLLYRWESNALGERYRAWLLLDYGKHWDYPKGHLEVGESAWQAAVRELREETGIRQVDRRTKFRQQMHYQFTSSTKGVVAKTVTYFIAETKSQEVQVSDEHTGYAWLTYQEALRVLTFENARALLIAAEEALQ